MRDIFSPKSIAESSQAQNFLTALRIMTSTRVSDRDPTSRVSLIGRSAAFNGNRADPQAKVRHVVFLIGLQSRRLFTTEYRCDESAVFAMQIPSVFLLPY